MKDSNSAQTIAKRVASFLWRFVPFGLLFQGGTIVLAWLVGARQDKSTAFFSMLLVSFSYVLILYSSEARGYAPLIFFCFLCFLILHSFFENPRWQLAVMFSLGAITRQSAPCRARN